jgi:hypothetical protein
LTFPDPNPKTTFSNVLFKKDEKRTRKDEKMTRKDDKRKKDLFLLICLKKDRKDNKRQKTPRVPSWGFIPFGNIIVFFLK